MKNMRAAAVVASSSWLRLTNSAARPEVIPFHEESTVVQDEKNAVEQPCEECDSASSSSRGHGWWLEDQDKFNAYKVDSSGSASSTALAAPKRRLIDANAPAEIFEVEPSASHNFHDGHDDNCDRITESPAEADPNEANYPRDATGLKRREQNACGVGPIRFNFKTSDLDYYDEITEEGSMMLHIVLGNSCDVPTQRCEREAARFIESETCENVLDATGGIGIFQCLFRRNEAKIRLAADLDRNTQYSITIKVKNPATTIRISVEDVETMDRTIAALGAPLYSAIGSGTEVLGSLTGPLRIGDYGDPNTVYLQEEEVLLAEGAMNGKALGDLSSIVLPATLVFTHEYKAEDNQFMLYVMYFQVRVIEQQSVPGNLGYVVHNAKHPSHGDYTDPAGTFFDMRGYVTAFDWRPSEEYEDTPGTTSVFTFGLRTFGTMHRTLTWRINFVAIPSNVWALGENASACPNFVAPPSVTQIQCQLFTYHGQPSTVANGFQLIVTSNDINNLGGDQRFSMRLPNPDRAVNMVWFASSLKIYLEQELESFTVLLDQPIQVQGRSEGGIVQPVMRPAINAQHFVTLEVRPGNNVYPQGGKLSTSGYLAIIPAQGFTVVQASTPREVYGKNRLPCFAWERGEQKLGRWLCNLQQRMIFGDTLYAVQLEVINPPAPQSAYSWRFEVWQMGKVKPLALSRDIGGFRVLGSMVASVEPTNQLWGNTQNLLTFKFTPSEDLPAVANGKLSWTAPAGFRFQKRCPGFEAVSLPTQTTCKGSDGPSGILTFENTDTLKGGQQYEFRLSAENPPEPPPDPDSCGGGDMGSLEDDMSNYWKFETLEADGLGKNTALFESFPLFPNDFIDYTVVPDSYRTGETLVTVRFIPAIDINSMGFIKIRAPVGIDWIENNLQASTDPADTKSNEFPTNPPVLSSEGMIGDGVTSLNTIVFQVTRASPRNFEYGFQGRLMVPESTPVPNRWWIEYSEEAGQPGCFELRASRGAEGFKTQAITNAAIEPYNFVAEAFQNPTIIRFETTQSVQSVISALGTVITQAQLKVQAPPDFTFICPFTHPELMPVGHKQMPVGKCVINQQDPAERNKVYIEFQEEGLDADTKYVFQVEIVNGALVNPTTNFFILETSVDGDVKESVTLPGYELAQAMRNTRYVPDNNFGREDRRVSAYDNYVTFILGTTQSMPELSMMRVQAPKGFVFDANCRSNVGNAPWAVGVGMADFPTVSKCESLIYLGNDYGNIAEITLGEQWPEGDYAFYARVGNPTQTASRNYWSFKIYDPGNLQVAKMAEAWVRGFDIQAVLPPISIEDPYMELSANITAQASDAIFFAYSINHAIAGAAAPSVLLIRFRLTSRLPDAASDTKGSHIIIVPSMGFVFPNICRDFSPETSSGYEGLPAQSTCDGGKMPELTYVYYRLGHENFEREYGVDKRMVAEDCIYELVYEEDYNEMLDMYFQMTRFKVVSVRPGGPAEKARIRPGYIMTSMTLFPEDNQLKDTGYMNQFIKSLNDTQTLDFVEREMIAQSATAMSGQTLLTEENLAIMGSLMRLFDEEQSRVEFVMKGPALTISLPPNFHLAPEITYAFEVLVENPAETFTDGDQPDRWWALETRKGDNNLRDRIDLNYEVPSYSINERLTFFALYSLRFVGSAETMLKLSINIKYDLPPGQKITVLSPEEVIMNPPDDPERPCMEQTLTGAELADLNSQFISASIKDATTLPEYVKCYVASTNILEIRNESPLRGGRSLMAGPTYDLIVESVINPASTPRINFFRIIAETLAPGGREAATTNGYTIFPELQEAVVVSSNPGLGLFTNFTFTVGVLTQVPEEGTIYILAPRSDYYFGPRLPMRDAAKYDPLSSVPPPAGEPTDRPPPSDDWRECEIMPPEMGENAVQFQCPITFQSCIDKADLEREDKNALVAQHTDTINDLTPICLEMETKCRDRKYSELFSCMTRTSLKSGSRVVKERALIQRAELDLGAAAGSPQLDGLEAELVVGLRTDVVIPSGAILDFRISGYNTDVLPTRWSKKDENGNVVDYCLWCKWDFATRSPDSGKTTIDEKVGVEGFDLKGVVFVDQIIPSATSVSRTENLVTVRMRLTTVVGARALIRIEYPSMFIPVQTGNTQNAGAEASLSSGASIKVGTTIPRKVLKRHVANIIELELAEDQFDRRPTILEFTVLLSNPTKSPVDIVNVWKFATYSGPISSDPNIDISTMDLLDVNYDVAGFRIYGQFRNAQIASAIASPTVRNKVGVWFVFESDLEASVDSFLHVYMPQGFVPLHICGIQDFRLSYQHEDFIGSVNKFPADKAFIPLPSGSTCETATDERTGQHYIKIKPDGVLVYGSDYAFTFGVTNAEFVNPDENFWRFETTTGNVLLHLKQQVSGYQLEELKSVMVDPYDTTAQLLSRIDVLMESNKFIPSGSEIKITTPKGFSPTCWQFKTPLPLAATTTCRVDGQVIAFRMDTGNFLEPNTPFKFEMWISNPKFTPQPNSWKFQITDAFDMFVDIKSALEGYPITGPLDAFVKPYFTYKNQRNDIEVIFVPSRIMNQADKKNLLRLRAPDTFVFPDGPCRNSQQKVFLSDTVQPGVAVTRSSSMKEFPPPGTICRGYGNETLEVEFPSGAGVLVRNYTLIAEVMNPGEDPPNRKWIFETWKYTDDFPHGVPVDANRDIPGFQVIDLAPLGEDPDTASRSSTFFGAIIAFFVCLFSTAL